ncbi:MAG: hypothetical protein PHZ19_02710 [Candidatus Thermoplasmatota archaeon]|nr:hypothetical protein [Candidatus Thermoplasmatota archaeon]
MNSTLKKGAFGMTGIVAIITVIIFVILLGTGASNIFKRGVINATEKLENETGIEIGLKLDTSIEESSYPYDSCGNGKGSSLQDSTKSSDPDYEKCAKVDCCDGFVYAHILDLSTVVEDKFVHIKYTTEGASKVMFYYSETGNPADWHKFYHTEKGKGDYQITLPIAEKFRFIKVESTEDYLKSSEVRVIPWVTLALLPARS